MCKKESKETGRGGCQLRKSLVVVGVSSGAVGERNLQKWVKTSGIQGGKVKSKHAGVLLN